MSETGDSPALVTHFFSFSESWVTMETKKVSKTPRACQHSIEVALSLYKNCLQYILVYKILHFHPCDKFSAVADFVMFLDKHGYYSQMLGITNSRTSSCARCSLPEFLLPKFLEPSHMIPPVGKPYFLWRGQGIQPEDQKSPSFS